MTRERARLIRQTLGGPGSTFKRFSNPEFPSMWTLLGVEAIASTVVITFTAGRTQIRTPVQVYDHITFPDDNTCIVTFKDDINRTSWTFVSVKKTSLYNDSEDLPAYLKDLLGQGFTVYENHDQGTTYSFWSVSTSPFVITIWGRSSEQTEMFTIPRDAILVKQTGQEYVIEHAAHDDPNSPTVRWKFIGQAGGQP